MRLLSRLTSVAVAVAAVTMALASPAVAAPTYWKFKNETTQQCLTSGVKGGTEERPTASVYLRSCVASDYQEWDWRGTGTYKALQNRKTGLCLKTDDKGGADAFNAVWTSKCTTFDNPAQDNQSWAWYSNKWLNAEISGFLRSDPKPGAVYVHDNYFNDRSDWYGYAV